MSVLKWITAAPPNQMRGAEAKYTEMYKNNHGEEERVKVTLNLPKM